MKFLIISNYSYSLVNMRGYLISEIKKNNNFVMAASPDLCERSKNILPTILDSHIPIRVKRSSLNPIADILTFFDLCKLIYRYKPDVVLAYTIKPIIWGGLASRIFNTKFNALITGLGYSFQGGSGLRKLLLFLVSNLYKAALKKSHSIMFQNTDNMVDFIERGIVDRLKCHVVPGSGVDLDYYKFTQLPISKNIVFLCIARLLNEKGIREYANAAQIVKLQYPESKFLLVGDVDPSPDGVDILEVDSWVESGSIDYLGCVNDVRDVIKNCHIFVLPSYHEGLPRSTVEAMSMGRAILTTNAVGCKDTVIDGINGFKVLVKDERMLAQKMIWFIDNSNLIKDMGIASRKIAKEKFDVHKVNKQMMEIMSLNI
jgi:glycosyltransferase involved in cell wall biosynthesis